MLTAGRIPVTLSFDPAQALQTLCAGQDVLLATIASPGIAPIDPARIPAWIAAIPWSPPSTETWPQRDGAPLLTATRWLAVPRRAEACPTSSPLPSRGGAGGG